jgi:serine/threonine protein kinase
MQDVAGRTLPYFVMEFIEDARPVTAYATDRGLGIRQRVELFRDVCQAVAHGHHKGIVHRDLKPGKFSSMPMASQRSSISVWHAAPMATWLSPRCIPTPGTSSARCNT